MRGRSLALGAILLAVVAGDAVAAVLIDTTSLSLRDDISEPVDPGKRSLRFKSSTRRSPAANRIVVPAPGGPADPRATGATLVVQGTSATADRVQLPLPAARWTLIGTTAKPKGYKYEDTTRGAPVSKLVMKADLVSVRAGGAGFGYSLDEPQQGRVGLRLTLGGTEWCTDAPAKSARDDVPGKFTATPKTPAPTTCAVGAPEFTLTVTNGNGSGTYPAGSTIHVWAAVRPQDQLVTGWSGDASLLADPAEWHSTLVMPARDAAVAATIVDRPTTLAVSTFTGSTTRPKTVRSFVPPSPRGLVLFLHGTGGSNRFIASTETFYVALRAIESGYGVLGTEAEEAVGGDLDGDGKERWDVGLTAGNVDFANLNALVASLRAAGTIGADTPLFVLGMSNGGAMAVGLGAIGAAPIAPVFPQLRFGAVVSHCASARVGAVAITTTPTAWLLCANDDNAEVDNAEALANSATLASRGVATLADLHPASPLYDVRFARDAGVSTASSGSLAAELRAAGFAGLDGFFTTPTTAIVAAVTADPALLPTLVSLPPAVRATVVDQVRVMQAEHQMFSDWAARAVAFLDAHNP